MLVLGPIGFTAPWVLTGLLVLPVLWLLLRAVPPAPIRRRFAGVALLLGLTDETVETDRTPWWLLLLRMCAVAALIVGFSGPVLNPKVTAPATGPLIVVVDGTWADAPIWSARINRLSATLDSASQAQRLVSVVVATDPPLSGGGDQNGATARENEVLQFRAARDWAPLLAGLAPAPYTPVAADFIDALRGVERAETIWLSDGLAYEGRDAMLAALQALGPVSVVQEPRVFTALGPVRRTQAGVTIPVHGLGRGTAASVASSSISVLAYGPDPSGIERVLGQADVPLADGVTPVSFDLPPELRNRVTRFEVADARSAAAVQLADDSLRRREVALISGGRNREELQLLSQLHYLRAAFEGRADVVEGAFGDLIAANPDVIVLADVARLAGSEMADLLDWTRQGGLLLRFAGPRLAASDVARDAEDPLMPVRLRAGGRTIGGAMSWGEPKRLRPFAETSPFYGLPIPDDVTVSAQVMAQPDPDLSARVIATLADGTPLVTRKAVGEGQVVLVHVTANADWSTLPLSGLFVSMLERLTAVTRGDAPEAADLAGQRLRIVQTLDGFGRLSDAGALPPVAGEDIAGATASRDRPAGLYASESIAVALNVFGPQDRLEPALWPDDVTLLGGAPRHSTPLLPYFLFAALGTLALDVIASLALTGRLLSVVMFVAVALSGAPKGGQAETLDDAFAFATTGEVTLAHVLTGDPRVDHTAHQGLVGLSRVLASRTSVEPEPPLGVSIETDALDVFPLLYWPVTPQQPLPSADAYAKLNAYMRSGGMILFDTRDGDIAGFGAATPNGTRLQTIARALDIPPLEPVPADHVLTRSFYLLQDFPGRFTGGDLWLEAAPKGAEAAEGMPFRNLNDNVTPVVIGGNDWAAAWAVTDAGRALHPIGSGFGGDRQREIANRFGVNLVMYVLTGNYKSDQVHVPALLERLGQ